MPSFRSINFSLGDDGAASRPRLRPARPTFGMAPAGPAAPASGPGRPGESDEAACRRHLQTFLEDSGEESLARITAPDRPELVPDMRLSATAAEPNLSANSVVFQQSAHAIPIFGSRIAVDIDSADRSLVAINGKVTPQPDIDPIADISAGEALDRLLAWGGTANGRRAEIRRAVAPPVLTWYLDEEASAWHLVHHFAAVPMAPRDEEPPLAGDPFPELAHSCLRPSPRSEAAIYDYFVDAHDGAVIFYFSSTPRLDVPAPMKGIDSLDTARDFFGLQQGSQFALVDPLRNIETYDYKGADLDAQPPPAFPAQPLSYASSNIGSSDPAAVSAHFHAKLVFDFFNRVLARDGVDDKGMKLVSVVNVYSSNQNPLPEPQWGNAVWWQNKMWYGQEDGVSYAKHLDIIAHELTHGVTETSAQLIYRRLPGALNESFSDVFGIIIANWYPGEPNPLSGWSWEIGPGLGAGGEPIRDFADPARTGQPDHFSKYKVLPLSYDEGGVHIYSGIHNKAIHRLLTGVDGEGAATFPIGEAVLLLYLTLTRLTPTSDFRDSRRTLESVTRTYHASDPATMNVRLAAIAAAFGAVGL